MSLWVRQKIIKIVKYLCIGIIIYALKANFVHVHTGFLWSSSDSNPSLKREEMYPAMTDKYNILQNVWWGVGDAHISVCGTE